MSQADPGQTLHDFLSHAETVVDAPAGRVWSAVLNPNDWHGTIMAHVSGPKDEVGEYLEVTPADQPETVMLRVHNVEMEPHKRRTIRIHTGDDAFTGYSTWTLHDRGEQTLVTYDVFTRYPFPSEMTVEQVRDISRQGNEEGLRRLKAFVETGVRS
jgi:hypothetical protein